MSTISSGTTLTTALVQTGDTTGDLVIKTGASNTTAMTISGTDQSVVINGSLTANVNVATLTGIVAVANGGTGLSSSGTLGNVLTSNGTAWTSTAPAAGYTNADALTLFNASGSAPVYACRAWVNFDGTGTPAIRGSGNVSSITDNGTGDYTVNFTTAMPDVNYASIGSGQNSVNASAGTIFNVFTRLTSSLQIKYVNDAAAARDGAEQNVAIFR
jgi:hypothetical protein